MGSNKIKSPEGEREAWVVANSPVWKCGHVALPSEGTRIAHDPGKRPHSLATGLCGACLLVKEAERAEEYENDDDDDDEREAESYWHYRDRNSYKTGDMSPTEKEDKGRDSHTTEYVAKSTVKKTYGFTETEVQKLLGDPDRFAANPHYRTSDKVCLYLRSRVLHVCASEAYMQARARSASRRKNGADTPLSVLVAAAAAGEAKRALVRTQEKEKVAAAERLRIWRQDQSEKAADIEKVLQEKDLTVQNAATPGTRTRAEMLARAEAKF